MNKITIRDVAREAGVSIATVSNSLNGSDVVQPKTREHVLEVARQLNYIPNVNGRQLRAAQTRNIGLFVTSMTGSYYGNMADSIHYLCRKYGYDLQMMFDGFPGSGRSLGERNGNLLQYACLENLMDRGAWWATVHRVTKSQTQLNTQAQGVKRGSRWVR